MATIEIVPATGRSTCRGGDPKCLANSNGKIPKDSKALRISIYGAGGDAVAFYCSKCMMSVLDDCKKTLDDV